MQRNITLDIAKMLLSFLVIAVHLPLFIGMDSDTSYMLGWLFSNGVSRIAVPCFFMINGYFINISDKQKVTKSVRHLSILYVAWMIIYLPAYYSSIIGNPKYLATLLLFGYHHLWYIVSVIIDILLLYLIKRYLSPSRKQLVVMIVSIYIIGYFIQDILTILHPASSQYIILYRNFLFFGFPFFTIGHILKTSNIIIDIRRKNLLYLAIGIGSVALLLEAYFSFKFKLGVNLYLSLLILCPPLLILLFNSKWAKSTSLLSDVTNAVFFTHVGILLILRHYFIGQSNITLYPLAIAFSIIVSFLVYVVNKKVKFLL